jgi:hypothetical protein
MSTAAIGDDKVGRISPEVTSRQPVVPDAAAILDDQIREGHVWDNATYRLFHDHLICLLYEGRHAC